MALTKNTAATPKFEALDGDGIDGVDGTEQTAEEAQAAIRADAQKKLAAAAAQHAASKPAEEVKASESRAVAPAASRQVAVAKPMVNPLEPLKDAFRVEWDTLRGLKVTNGNVLDNQTGKTLGDVVGLELLSFQDQWVISPGTEGDEGKDEVRYSDDGKTTTKGEDCNEYLARLKAADYPKASMTKRVVICGSLFDIGDKGRKDCKELQDSLVQLSLAPTSKASFDRYMMDQAYKIGKGIIEPEGAQRLRLSCDIVTKGKQSWTVVNVTRYDAPAAA